MIFAQTQPHKLIFFSLVFLFAIAPQAHCKISFDNGNWSSSLATCGEYPSTCDGLSLHNSSDRVAGLISEVKEEHNHPLGTGKGLKMVIGDGLNSFTGSFLAEFPGSGYLDEVWIRFYMKYELGFSWQDDDISHDKLLYFGNGPVLTFAHDGFKLSQLGADQEGYPENYHFIESSTGGFRTINGGVSGDGKWHAYELYVKKDSGGFTGKYYLWVDGLLKEKHDNVNFNNESFGYYVILKSNQDPPLNGGYSFVYFDDYAISTNPLNVDAGGNRFIGPINWNDEPSEPHPPANLRANNGE